MQQGFQPWMQPGASGSGPSRLLFHIPIIHSRAELGSLGPRIAAITIQKRGADGWARKVDTIDLFWTQIENAIDQWALPAKHVRLYQDGLPVCGRETEIVAELAGGGSRNHQLLRRLQARGATLMGTEPADLLVQEYTLVKATLASRDPAAVAPLQELSRSLLKRRDEAIAQRINATLGPGETGLLFLGLLHSLDGLLANDIQVIRPIRIEAS